MNKYLHPLLGLLLSFTIGGAFADTPASATPSAPSAGVAFSLIKTGHTHAQAGMVYSGGSVLQKLVINHGARVVEP
ncbi:MAG: hypothetical protein ACHQIO_11890, partial [Nevskiales bacterium]